MNTYTLYISTLSTQLNRMNDLLSIISVPESFTLVRLDSLSITTFPFRNHPMVGLGSPDAWQGNIATVLIGSV